MAKVDAFPIICDLSAPHFWRTRKHLAIDDLKLNTLRREATSHLFEADLSIKRVALVMGHRDCKMLRRYTNPKPEDLQQLQKYEQVSEEALILGLAMHEVHLLVTRL